MTEHTNDNKKQEVKCPECENTFDFDTSDVQVGDIIECPICGATLEVITLEPFTIDSITTYK
jgi:lysine biosynthesis protein LysW